MDWNNILEGSITTIIGVLIGGGVSIFLLVWQLNKQKEDFKQIQKDNRNLLVLETKINYLIDAKNGLSDLLGNRLSTHYGDISGFIILIQKLENKSAKMYTYISTVKAFFSSFNEKSEKTEELEKIRNDMTANAEDIFKSDDAKKQLEYFEVLLTEVLKELNVKILYLIHELSKEIN